LIRLLGGFSEAAEVNGIAEKIIRNIKEPFNIEGNELQIGVSIDISIYPDDGSDEQSLLRKADLAMYHAKQSGHRNFSFSSDLTNLSE
jgi:GGDEF domain-containing protein